MNAPLTWLWNRFEDSSVTTIAGQQDYVVNLPSVEFIEKVSLTDPQGKIWELKDVYNTAALSMSTVQQRPSAVAVMSYVPGVSIKIRFLGVPDQAYQVNITYQGAAVQFGPFVVNSVTNVAGGNTTYAGIFTPASFPVGSTATINGFSSNAVVSPVSSVAAAVTGNTTYTGVFTTASFPIGGQATIIGFTKSFNNGTFTIVSVNGTSLVLANPSGVVETATAQATGIVSSANNGVFTVVSVTTSNLVLANPNGILEIPPPFTGTAINSSWAPIPDQYSDVYNNLFLSEAFQAVSEDIEAARYRQRGVAMLLSKAEGLTVTQRNAWAQQWLARGTEQGTITLQVQQAGQARGV